MKFHLVILALIVIMIPRSAQSAGNGVPKEDWVFFDMGDVLIDTEQPKQLHYVKGAEAFLNSLRSHGYKIGLLINIPEHFGMTCDKKFKKLKHVLETTWTDKSSLKWGLFDRIFLPPNNEYRKPHPLLFSQAMSISCPASIVFFGEDLSEVNQAKKMGFTTFVIDKSEDSPFPTVKSMRERMTIIGNRATLPKCQTKKELRATMNDHKKENMKLCEISP